MEDLRHQLRRKNMTMKEKILRPNPTLIDALSYDKDEATEEWLRDQYTATRSLI